MIMQNVMETLVELKLNEIIDKLDCCKCEQCRMDIMTYALNRLPPKYVATYEGSVYSKLGTLSLQYETDMLTVLMQGAQIVKVHPRHNGEIEPAELGK
jgi:competence protein ComFB